MANSKAEIATTILSNALRELRENAGMTQAILASRMRVSQSFISKYESGERKLTFADVHRICVALNASFEAFAANFASAVEREP